MTEVDTTNLLNLSGITLEPFMTSKVPMPDLRGALSDSAFMTEKLPMPD